MIQPNSPIETQPKTSTMTRIRVPDLEYIRERAKRNHRTIPEEISAICDGLREIVVIVNPPAADPAPVKEG